MCLYVLYILVHICEHRCIHRILPTYVHVFCHTPPSLIPPTPLSTSYSDNHHCEVEDVHLEEKIPPTEGSTDCLFQTLEENPDPADGPEVPTGSSGCSQVSFSLFQCAHTALHALVCFDSLNLISVPSPKCV